MKSHIPADIVHSTRTNSQNQINILIHIVLNNFDCMLICLKIIRIQNTLHLKYIQVSRALLPDVEADPRLTLVDGPED